MTPLFVWQPHPGYKYDRRLHKTFPFEGEVPRYFQGVFVRLESYEASDFLYLGALTEHSTRKAYVDDVHYSESMSEQIALQIAQAINTRGPE